MISSTMLASRIVRVTLTLLLIDVASGFQFYLHSGERRCFTETVSPGTKVLGEYTVSTGKGNMMVDISVTVPGENRNLYQQRNIGHGKFAFVVPLGGSTHEQWRVLAAELHRRRLQKNIGKPFQNPPSKARGESIDGNHRRKLLSSGYTDNSRNTHSERGHERQFDEHGRAKPPADHEKRYEEGIHHDDYHDSHHDSHGHEDRESRRHGHHHNHDDDDYDYGDAFDDFDMDEYDGIHDEELDDDLEHERTVRMKEHGADEDDPVTNSELYEDKKIEVCVSSEGATDAHRRRVRLIIHKGETAHDYTRLAKREHMTQLEVSLRRASEELHELMRELDKARQREDGLRKVNEGTSGRVVMLAVVSLVSLAAVGGYQAMYTKQFLKRKKIL